MIKLSNFLFLFLLASICSFAQNNKKYSLDEAIRISAENIDRMLSSNVSSRIVLPDIPDSNTPIDSESIRQRTERFTEQKPIIAILNLNSQSSGLSSYIIEELTLALAGNDKFIIVDRQRLALIRQEEKFQLSGEVSDGSAQAIGKKLGAQYVITGSFLDMKDFYRFRIMALVVETAAISAPTSLNINKRDRQVASLLANKKNDDIRIAAELESQRRAEERRERGRERQRKVKERRENSSMKNEYAFRNYLSLGSGGFFQWGDEGSFGGGGHLLEAHWSPLPYTNIGLEFNIYKYGDMKRDDDVFGGSFSLGFVYPLINQNEFIFSIFGDGLLETAPYKYNNKKGLLAERITPAINTGMLFYWDSADLGFEVSYKGTFLENYYVHGISIKFIWYCGLVAAFIDPGAFMGSNWKTW